MKKKLILLFLGIRIVSAQDTVSELLTAAEKTNDPKKSLSLYNKALTYDSLNALVYLNRGVTYFQLERIDDALQDFTKTIQIESKLKPAAVPQGDKKAKIQIVSVILPTAWFYRGQLYLEKEEYQLAANDFDEILKESATFEQKAAVYLKRAVCAEKLGKTTEVLGFYDKAVEADPQNMEILISRIIYKITHKMYDEALKDISTGSKLEPKMGIFYLLRGDILRTNKKFKAAYEQLDKAIALEPNNADFYSDKGMAYAEGEDYPNAIAAFDKALALDPKHFGALSNRGTVKTHLKKYQEALKDFNQAIAIEPTFPYAYNNRGVCKLGMKQYDEALVDFDKSLSLKNDKKYYAYNNRGKAYFELGRYQDALNDHQKAVELGGTSFYGIFSPKWDYHTEALKKIKK